MPMLNLNPALKTCHYNDKLGSMLLPAGRMQYPALFEPQAMKGESAENAKYQISIMFPRDAELALAAKWVEEIAAEKWGPKSTKPYKKPFLNHAEKTSDLELAANFPVLIRCNSPSRPGVVFGNSDPVTAKEEIYSGRWAVIAVRGYAWEFSGVRGVSFGVNNVMVLDHDDPIGNARPKPEMEFASILAVTGGSANPDQIFEQAKPDQMFGVKPAYAGRNLFD
jgi:hypothetical protein